MTRTKLVLLLLFAAGTASAQYTSGLEGTVVDQSGSAVADSHVIATNDATEVTTETNTNNSGYFRISELAPGTYHVKIQLAGFNTWVETEIHIDADQLRTIYPKLSIGQQKAEINVSAHAEAIETGQSAVATSITQTTIANAPMLGRNVYGGVSFIAPGVTGSGVLFGGGASGNAGQDSFQTQPGFQINAVGQRQENNEYQVDGSSVNGDSRDGIANLTPEPDTVQEIRVSAATFTGERAHNSGALVQVFTKSGTNQLHGTVSEFHTDNALTSRTIFQRSIPAFRRNEYGGTLGGAAVKDKTFLFGSYYRLSSSNSQTDVVSAETQQFVQYLQQYYPNNVSTKILTQAPIGSYPLTGFVTAVNYRRPLTFHCPRAFRWPSRCSAPAWSTKQSPGRHNSGTRGWMNTSVRRTASSLTTTTPSPTPRPPIHARLSASSRQITECTARSIGHILLHRLC